MSERLKAAREIKRMKQNDVAKYLGIAYSTYVQKENGHYEFTLSEIKKLLELFDKKFEELF